MFSRLLILGLDGATWDVLTPLTAMGVMPNLRRLMQESVLVELNSTQPFITPVAWTSFQTGCDPREHGILDYRYFDHDHRQLCLNNATRIRRETLFESVSAAGGEVVSLNLPMTYPSRTGVSGIVVGGLDSPSIRAALAPYPQFADRLRARGTALNLKPIWKRAPQSFEELSTRVAETVIDFRSRVAAAHVADELTDWRLLFVQFQALDALQHRAWHLLSSTGFQPVIASNGHRLEACATAVAKLHEAFHALDRAIGDLAELAQRRSAGLVVVSDHGFGSFRGKISLPELLARRGLLSLSRVNRFGHRLSRARFRARKWLWRRRHSGASAASLQRPLEMLLPIDWRSSRAVALHGDLAGLVYLNTPDRFGGGPLTTRSLQDEALAEAMAALREARHPDTDEPLFDDVYSVQERHRIDVLDYQWPDILAIPTAGFQTRTKLDRVGQLLVADPNLTGTHRLQGVLMLPRAAAARCPRQAEMRDVAPTLLNLLGVAPPATMSGGSLSDRREVIATATDLATPKFSPTPSPGALTATQQSLVESRLRELGYLD
jgi:predicted AlkP superfamily phosphohydrolase/phosphomutase